jgi:hypothetical protein
MTLIKRSNDDNGECDIFDKDGTAAFGLRPNHFFFFFDRMEKQIIGRVCLFLNNI